MHWVSECGVDDVGNLFSDFSLEQAMALIVGNAEDPWRRKEMTTLQRYKNIIMGVRDTLTSHIDAIEECNDPEFKKELGLDWWKTAKTMTVRVEAETMNGKEQIYEETFTLGES